MTLLRGMLLVLLALPVWAFAVPTGLNAMPTADVLTIGQARFDYEPDGSGKLFVPPDGTVYGSQVGLILGLEGGADQVLGKGAVYNLKWRVKDEGIVSPAMAVGVQNVTPGEKPQFYAVVTKTFLLASASAGILHDGNTKDDLTMLGGRVRFNPLEVRADILNGGALDRTSVGADLRLGGLIFSATAYDYRNAPRQTSFAIGYQYSAF